MCNFEYIQKDGIEYEISYYYFQIEDDIFLCKISQNTIDGEDYNLSVATTLEDYEFNDLNLCDETLISKKNLIGYIKNIKLLLV